MLDAENTPSSCDVSSVTTTEHPGPDANAHVTNVPLGPAGNLEDTVTTEGTIKVHVPKTSGHMSKSRVQGLTSKNATSKGVSWRDVVVLKKGSFLDDVTLFIREIRYGV